jgi:hypothetical protein
MAEKTISVFDALKIGALVCSELARRSELEAEGIDESKMYDESDCCGE